MAYNRTDAKDALVAMSCKTDEESKVFNLALYRTKAKIISLHQQVLLHASAGADCFPAQGLSLQHLQLAGACGV